MSPNEPEKPDAVAKRAFRRDGVIESGDLFAERNEVQIRHEGQVYRLRVTKNGKLILNK
jgi:hemin uptake protein HemP